MLTGPVKANAVRSPHERSTAPGRHYRPPDSLLFSLSHSGAQVSPFIQKGDDGTRGNQLRVLTEINYSISNNDEGKRETHSEEGDEGGRQLSNSHYYQSALKKDGHPFWCVTSNDEIDFPEKL